jgi:hypothetical protein
MQFGRARLFAMAVGVDPVAAQAVVLGVDAVSFQQPS